MQTHLTQKQGNDRLLVLVLGWAADHRIVEHLYPVGCDVLCCYNYQRDGKLDLRLDMLIDSLIGSYREVFLLGWSFGVWVAGELFAGQRFTRAVAFNGTPMPVHELYGIEPRRMAVTIRGLSSGGMEAFERRAYAEHYDDFKHLLSPRPLQDNIAELEVLAHDGAVPGNNHIAWDKAVIGNRDQIFLPENMIRYWSEVANIETEVLPLPHFPFADAMVLENEIG